MKLKISKRSAILSILLVATVLVSIGSLWPIQISRVNMQTEIPQDFAKSSMYRAFAQTLTNSSGDFSLSVQNFNYSTPDGKTKLSASSASIAIVITPQGQNSRVDLNIQFSDVYVVSPDFTGAFSSAKMSGFVKVDPETNKMIVSMVTSTTILDMVKGIIGI